jgi:nicotinate phosphoribosyltransferase
MNPIREKQAAMMDDPEPLVTDENIALLTDLYELTMLQAYWRERRTDTAVFSLFVRRLPENRNFLLACGLDSVLRYLERLRFGPAECQYLRTTGRFDHEFTDWLADLRFTGSVRAVPEGTPVFAEEPILEIEAPLPEAQIAETFIMNQVHLQTMLASKAARVVRAADGRNVIDFGLRRMHGIDAGIKAARAFHVAGIHGTSNVLANRLYGVPVSGTMAHSYIQAHDDELTAFRSFAQTWPDTVLLVDTYDTLDGVRNVVRLSNELGDAFQVRGIRLDSGDLGALAKDSRRILDDAGLDRVSIFASSGLDEDSIRTLVDDGAPIDGFGVGTRMGVSADAPSLDIVYKLAEYGGRGRLKLSTGKRVLPGLKQVFRFEENGEAVCDVIGRADESLPGRPLLHEVMRDGRRLDAGRVDLDEIREYAAREMAALPDRIRDLDPAEPPYDVSISEALDTAWRELAHEAGG